MHMCIRRSKFKLKCVSQSLSLVCLRSESKQGLIGPGCSCSLEMTQGSKVGFSVSEVGMTNPHHRKSTEEYTHSQKGGGRETPLKMMNGLREQQKQMTVAAAQSAVFCVKLCPSSVPDTHTQSRAVLKPSLLLFSFHFSSPGLFLLILLAQCCQSIQNKSLQIT